MIYYILPLYSFLLSLCTFKRARPKQLVYLLSAAFLILVFFVGGFRGKGIGSDYFSYYYIFRDNEDIELGFSYLADLLKMCGGSFSVFIAMIFTLSFSLKYFVFSKMSAYPFLSLMIYLGFWFLVYDMNGIRQGLALGLVGLASYSLWKGYIKMYWVCCILAVLFHYSSIVFLPFIFLVRKKCTLKIIVCILVGAFLFALLSGLTNVLFLIIGNDSYFIEKIIAYGSEDKGSILFSFSTIHRFFIFILLYLIIPKARIDDQLKNMFLWAATFNVMIYLLFADVEIVATRLSLYYRFLECISLAAIPSAFYRRSNQFVVLCLLCIYVLWQVYVTLSIPDNNLIPYYTIF